MKKRLRSIIMVLGILVLVILGVLSVLVTRRFLQSVQPPPMVGAVPLAKGTLVQHIDPGVSLVFLGYTNGSSSALFMVSNTTSKTLRISPIRAAVRMVGRWTGGTIGPSVEARTVLNGHQAMTGSLETPTYVEAFRLYCTVVHAPDPLVVKTAALVHKLPGSIQPFSNWISRASAMWMMAAESEPVPLGP